MMNGLTKEIMRIIFIFTISCVFYQGDIRSLIAFFCLMLGVFYIIPGMCIFVYNEMKGDDEDD